MANSYVCQTDDSNYILLLFTVVLGLLGAAHSTSLCLSGYVDCHLAIVTPANRAGAM